MKRFLLLLAWTLSAAAQWIHYPTAGVPRMADGKADLTAPAPRLNGKPDFSGMWGAAGTEFNCPNGICVLQMPLPVEARNIGTKVEGGLPYTAATAELIKRRSTEASKNDPHVRCTPPNFPRAWALPQFKRIVHTPSRIVVLHEFQSTYREIPLDGRPLPEVDKPAWSGYSSGQWDGDTLVVQSIGFRDDLWLDMLGNPLTSAAKVTERIRRPNFGSLEIEVTIDDRGAYTKPWTVKLNQSIVLDSEMMEEICLENEKSFSHLVGGK